MADSKLITSLRMGRLLTLTCVSMLLSSAAARPDDCPEPPFSVPPTVHEFFGTLMNEEGLSPREAYGFTMNEVHGVSKKCFEGLAEFDFFGVENRFNDASVTTGTPLVEFNYDGLPPADASENGERKLQQTTSMVHEGIEMFEDMGEEICRDAGGEYVTLDGTVSMDAESSYWFRTFAPAANLLKAPGLYRYGYIDPGTIMYSFEMYSFQFYNDCDGFAGDRKLANDKIEDSSKARRTDETYYGPFPLDVCMPYVEFRNRYACVPKKNACTDEEIATIITTSTVTMAESTKPLVLLFNPYENFGDNAESQSSEGADDPERKMTANKKSSNHQPKKQQQKKNAENDVSSADSKRKLEGHDWQPVSLFSKCTDVPTVTKVGKSPKASKSPKAFKSPKLRNRE